MSFASVLKTANVILSGVTTAVAVVVMAFSGYMIYENGYLQHRAYGMQYIDYKPVDQGSTISIDKLMEELPNSVGWITMTDTHIDYPVMQAEDDLYYVNRDPYGNPSLSGSIYLQAKNKSDFSDSYNLLYGHHMDNGAMFGDLTQYADPEFFSSHLYGKLVTLQEEYVVEVISLVSTDAYEQALYGITSLDWDGYTKTILNNENIEVVRVNPAITSADKFLVLSTCATIATDGRVLLICRLVPTGKTVEPTPEPTPTPAGKAPIVKTGDLGRGASWALLNLCCMILTIIAVLPYVLEMGDKENKETKRKTMRNYIGPFANVALAILALYLFFTYENMHLPMTMRDKYTPLMLFILGAALVFEEICSRRKKDREKEIEEIEDIDSEG